MMLIFLELVIFLVLSLTTLCQQPLSMAGLLLIFSFFSSVVVFLFFSSWFSFSLFLIYIGGMLVLFGYVIVLIPNFVFFFSWVALSFSFFFIFLYYPVGNVSFDFFDFSFSLFSFMNFYVYLFLSILLFIGLVSVVKVCFFGIGALRPFVLYV
uniref:NADH dehydrogenase subunit 6 n=1 Tax=Nemertopsis tetraclitophila TaxID=1417004 RepID=A0A075CFY5_9BILA|nr:NADH dehydrogenase subunit 6 [Nemertopsis tetraclitophila]AGZ63908.1 NADH dehydrogenase subunit 6 [Nemertopsis tetraclitophila]